MLRFLTGGESHGESLMAIIEGMPAGLNVSADYINRDLARRQKGYGRGKRMEIETDRVEILSGIRSGRTMGTPITLRVRNRDWENWKEIMSPEEGASDSKSVTRPRPGHADLSGGIKYRHKDFRNVLERASARETAARVAVGAVARALLERFGIEIAGHVISIGDTPPGETEMTRPAQTRLAEESPVRCIDKKAEKAMIDAIEAAAAQGETLGGIFEIRVFGMPVGLGTYSHWDRRLDGDLARAMMSIPAIKGVEIGLGFETARRPGSQVHDAIEFEHGKGFYRQTNRAGGIEGGVSNGENLVVRAAMKPIPTLMKPLDSVHFLSKRKAEAAVERSDVTAVPAAAVIGEAMAAQVLAGFMCEKFGGDSIEEMQQNFSAYQKYVKSL
jgi:chorismate synthase